MYAPKNIKHFQVYFQPKVIFFLKKKDADHHVTSNFRCPQLKPNELQDIVFLCTSLPTDKTFESLCRFPKVFFMLVNCKYNSHHCVSNMSIIRAIVNTLTI